MIPRGKNVVVRHMSGLGTPGSSRKVKGNEGRISAYITLISSTLEQG